MLKVENVNVVMERVQMEFVEDVKRIASNLVQRVNLIKVSIVMYVSLVIINTSTYCNKPIHSHVYLGFVFELFFIFLKFY